jgi:hypothetical protein
MNGSCEGAESKCHSEDAERSELHKGRTINIQVAVLGGRSLALETHLFATVSDIKALVCEHWGHPPGVQTLILDATILSDSDALLKDIQVDDGSLLTLSLSNEPLGQSLITEPDGNMKTLNRQGTPSEVLNEFQLMSLQAARFPHSDPAYADGSWGNLGAWDIDLYWTTRSNTVMSIGQPHQVTRQYRYEYWSTAPGDNECGALMRVDGNSVTCIGSGSDDGLRVFKSFDNDAIARQLVREGWPLPELFRPWDEDKAEETNLDLDIKAEERAMKAIKDMKKLTAQAKKKAIKKLPWDVQAKVMMAMKSSGCGESCTAEAVGATLESGGGHFDMTPAAGTPFDAASAKGGDLFSATSSAGEGFFGAAPTPTGGSIFGASLATGDGLESAPATTAGGLFSGASVFGAAAVTTGGGLFAVASATDAIDLFHDDEVDEDDIAGPKQKARVHLKKGCATAGGGLFGDATTGGGIFGAALTTSGGGIFGASLATSNGLFGAPATGAGSLFSRGGLSSAAPVATDGGLFGAAGAANSGAALAVTGGGLCDAAPATTDAGSGHSYPAGTSSKQDECKTQ